MTATLILGDCLAELPKLAAGSVDAIIADPPYLIGANSLGSSGSKMATASDWQNAAYWYSAWLKECFRLLKSDGWVFIFGTWRSLPMMTLAIGQAGLALGSTVIWDKEWIGTGSTKGFRSCYEMIFVAHKGSPRSFCDNGRPDVIRRKWMACHYGESGHPAEKPVDLVADLIKLSCPQGGLVLDPFLGSGTTAIACMKAACDFIGVESEEAFHAIAERRVRAAEAEVAAEARFFGGT